MLNVQLTIGLTKVAFLQLILLIYFNSKKILLLQLIVVPILLLILLVGVAKILSANAKHISCVTFIFIVFSGEYYYHHHHFTEEEAGSKRLRNLPKNTNIVKGGPHSQIQVSPVRERSSNIFLGKLYNKMFNHWIKDQYQKLIV